VRAMTPSATAIAHSSEGSQPPATEGGAKSPNAAARYAIASLGTSVDLAGQEDIARIIKAGGDIIDAPADAQEELPL